jgi:putative FmdB family regulatory protein
MPFYEYECSSCKFYVEALQKISDDPLKQCPSCKKQTLKKLVSAPVFRLKGSGWYETDFKSEGEDKRNLADRDEPAGKAEEKSSASDTKAEKPEKKAEAKAEVKTGSPAKKPAAKPAPAKGKKPAAKAPAKRPAPKKAAPAKKKAKRR